MRVANGCIAIERSENGEGKGKGVGEGIRGEGEGKEGEGTRPRVLPRVWGCQQRRSHVSSCSSQLVDASMPAKRDWEASER